MDIIKNSSKSKSKSGMFCFQLSAVYLFLCKTFSGGELPFILACPAK